MAGKRNDGLGVLGIYNRHDPKKRPIRFKRTGLRQGDNDHLIFKCRLPKRSCMSRVPVVSLQGQTSSTSYPFEVGLTLPGSSSKSVDAGECIQRLGSSAAEADLDTLGEVPELL